MGKKSKRRENKAKQTAVAAPLPAAAPPPRPRTAQELRDIILSAPPLPRPTLAQVMTDYNINAAPTEEVQRDAVIIPVFSDNPYPNCLHGAPPEDESIIEPKTGLPLCLVRHYAMKQMMEFNKKWYDEESDDESDDRDWIVDFAKETSGWVAYNIIDEDMMKSLYAEAVHYCLQGFTEESYVALLCAINLKYFLQVGPKEMGDVRKEVCKPKEVQKHHPGMFDMYNEIHKASGSEQEMIRLLHKEVPCNCMRGLKRNIKAKPKTMVCEKCEIEGRALLRCSRCKMVFYCNEQCQFEDWEDHKRMCKAVCHHTNKKSSGYAE